MFVGYIRALELAAARDDAPQRTIPYRSNLGGVYHRTDRFEEAIEVFEGALEIAPEDTSLRMNLEATIVDYHKFIMQTEIHTAAENVMPTNVFVRLSLICLACAVRGRAHSGTSKIFSQGRTIR